jgi:hypothetical protein
MTGGRILLSNCGWRLAFGVCCHEIFLARLKLILLEYVWLEIPLALSLDISRPKGEKEKRNTWGKYSIKISKSKEE